MFQSGTTFGLGEFVFNNEAKANLGDQMKFFLFLVVANAIGFAAMADSGPKLVSASYKNIYVPKGFDNNDNIQIAAEGVFINTCLKIAKPNVTVDERNKKITIDAKAYMYGGICMYMLVPFQQVIDVGLVRTPGTYVIQTGAGELIGQVEVAQARTEQPDDFLYAPVQRVSFEDGPENRVNLRIEFNHSCLELGEVKVDKQKNVVVIQPISQVNRVNGCAIGYYPTTKSIDLGQMNRGRYLLHVRSSGSQAQNQIITVE